MAEKRMFSNKIIGSGRFLRMPPTSRLLYYDLGMAADDDGIVEAFGVLRSDGCTEDDLRVLVAKGFIKILNEDLVALITDWKTNNSIRADRYHKGLYAELVRDNQMTTNCQPNDNQMTTNCQPNDNQMTTEIKVKDKDKNIYNINIVQNPPDFGREFERIWSLYPRKEGRKAAYAAFVRDRKKGAAAEDIEAGVRRYIDQIRANRTERKYVMLGSTYFGGRRWEDTYEDAREEYGEFYDYG